jgi:thiamine pyrophosphokinase
MLKNLLESPDVITILGALGGQTDYHLRVLEAIVSTSDLQAGDFKE